MREFEVIRRVEGALFAPPQPGGVENLPETPALIEKKDSFDVSEAAIQAAVKSAEISYPTRPQEVALKALEAAIPHLLVAARGTGTLRVNSIPEKAVEAAAEAIYSLQGKEDWNSIGYRLRWIFRDDARLILEAAAPHIQLSSVFWDDLAEDLKDPKFAAQYAKIIAAIQKEQNDK